MGAFIDSTLNDNEVVRYEAKVSIWSLIPWILLGALTITMVIGFIFWLVAFLKWWSTELAITDRKIIAKYGFISRNTIEILLPKVESVRINQGILGRILGYGTVVVSGTGSSHAPIKGISDPLIFRRQFMEIQQKIVG